MLRFASTSVLLEPTTVLFEPTSVLLESTTVLFEPTSLLFEPTTVLFEPSAVQRRLDLRGAVLVDAGQIASDRPREGNGPPQYVHGPIREAFRALELVCRPSSKRKILPSYVHGHLRDALMPSVNGVLRSSICPWTYFEHVFSSSGLAYDSSGRKKSSCIGPWPSAGALNPLAWRELLAKICPWTYFEDVLASFNLVCDDDRNAKAS